jgi:hypothetical protein
MDTCIAFRLIYVGYGVIKNITSLLNLVTAKKRPSLDAQKTRAIYKKALKGQVSIESAVCSS